MNINTNISDTHSIIGKTLSFKKKLKKEKNLKVNKISIESKPHKNISNDHIVIQNNQENSITSNTLEDFQVKNKQFTHNFRNSFQSLTLEKSEKQYQDTPLIDSFSKNETFSQKNDSFINSYTSDSKITSYNNEPFDVGTSSDFKTSTQSIDYIYENDKNSTYNTHTKKSNSLSSVSERSGTSFFNNVLSVAQNATNSLTLTTYGSLENNIVNKKLDIKYICLLLMNLQKKKNNKLGNYNLNQKKKHTLTSSHISTHEKFNNTIKKSGYSSISCLDQQNKHNWDTFKNDEKNAIHILIQKITGITVANSKRNKEFHILFKSIPEDDYLIDDYASALQKDILLHGRMYVSETYVCFNSNIFGWITNLVISFLEIVSIDKKCTAVVFPNAIQITTLHAKYIFSSFISRDTTYDLLINIWRLINPSTRTQTLEANVIDDQNNEAYEKNSIKNLPLNNKNFETNNIQNNENININENTVEKINETSYKNSSKKETYSLISNINSNIESSESTKHQQTECSCLLRNEHYEKQICDEIIKGPLPKVTDLCFGEEPTFMIDFLGNIQKVSEIKLGEWEKDSSGKKIRHISYLKPLYGPVGPKQTHCKIIETIEHEDNDYMTVSSITKTPDVPSGNSFIIKTKYCMMWGKNNYTRIIATCTTDWTKSSWLKSPIERGANEGQGMRPILLQGHERPLTQVKFNDDGDLLFSVSKDHIINVWFSHNGERLGTYHGHQATSTLMASGSADNTIMLWDVKTGKCLKVWKFPTAVKRVEFNEDNTLLLGVTEQRMGHIGSLVVFPIINDVNAKQTNTPIYTILTQESKATVAGWSYLSNYIIVGHENGSVSCYDAKEGKHIKTEQIHEKGHPITDLQFSPDRTYFITSSKDKTAKICDIESLKVLKTYVTDTPLNTATITPVKNFVILGGGQEARDVTTTSQRQGKFEAKFYHKIFEEEIGRVKGHFGPLNTIAVHPKGIAYASGSEDGYTRIHHFPQNYFDFEYNL
ncbi:hypothetical protein PCK1_002331 [Pneumocystis canis]|nr:hypothetical protein PCK1_002331 [Pneumocystis canis]